MILSYAHCSRVGNGFRFIMLSVVDSMNRNISEKLMGSIQ